MTCCLHSLLFTKPSVAGALQFFFSFLHCFNKVSIIFALCYKKRNSIPRAILIFLKIVFEPCVTKMSDYGIVNSVNLTLNFSF